MVVDGGQCQLTKNYLSQLSLGSLNFSFVSEPDEGISDAFNKALRMSKGDAVVFINSGDRLIDKNYFARCERRFLTDPSIDFIHAAVGFEDRVAGPIVLKPSLSGLGAGMPYRHQSMVVKRKVFEELGHFDPKLRLTMDYDFVCRMHLAGCKGFYDSTSAVVMMDGKGVSSTQELAAYREVSRLLTKYKLWNLSNLLGTVKRYLFYFVRRFLIYARLTSLLAVLKRLKHGTS